MRCDEEDEENGWGVVIAPELSKKLPTLFFPIDSSFS